ncbi:unnamed protein product [Symbiodinium sp. CCMP2456]|nr:unnamed protein product [Symbiodinium sp. CCMP2456]
MALARQLRRSLAGLGAYSLCLLGILLGPSGHLGGMFGPFIAVVSITLVCASGVYVVHIMSKTFSSQESAGQHVVLAFVWLIVLAVMLAVGMGPTQVAVELNLVSDLHGVSVCNWSDWSDTGGGVFFRDGTTLLGDSREELPISHVTVDRCDFQGFRRGFTRSEVCFTPVFDIRHDAMDVPPLTDPPAFVIAGCVSATLNCRELHLEGIKPLRVVNETQEELQPDSVDQASGGLLWEGALDLARHLAEGGLERMEPASGSPGRAPEAGARCLELGAGHGLPGLVALRHGYRVDFHDLSESTLRHITAANCAANDIQIGGPDEAGVIAHHLASDLRAQAYAMHDGNHYAYYHYHDMLAFAGKDPDPPARFVAGDWKVLKKKVEAAELLYDVILASEAVYKVDFYPDLLALLEHLAAGGRALFAGKRFYFGCGLEKSSAKASFATTAKDAGFHVVVAKVIEDGRSNIREILLISKPPQSAACKRQKVDAAELSPKKGRTAMAAMPATMEIGDLRLCKYGMIIREAAEKAVVALQGLNGWRDCSLFVEPILRCSGPEQRCKQVCAWAVSTTAIRAAFNGCGRQNGRRAICGIAVSMTRLTAGRCAGPVAQVDVQNCEEVTQRLAAQLDDIAVNMSLSTSWDGWDGAARPAPLLLMEDPRMIRTVLDFYIWTFAVLGFIYLPFPLLIVLCHQSLTSCAGPAWDLLCPWRRGSANSGQNYVALDQS